MALKHVSRSIFAVCALVTAGLVSHAQAAPIVVTQLTNNEADIVNTGGDVVSAANFGSQVEVGADGATLSVDINGIVHQVASAAQGGDGADLIANASINSTFDGHFRNSRAGQVGYTGDLRNLMAGIAGVASPGPLTLELSGLTPGKTYLFQGYWEANQYNQVLTVSFESTDTLSNITGNGMGTLISYQFTASDDTLNVSLTKTAGTDSVWLQGYSLQAVPEPGSMVIMGTGMYLLLSRWKAH